MSSVLDNIRKNDNDFSFISTFFDLVGNKEFKDAEISTLYTKAETSETSIWRSLSAVAEQLGSTFYSNTLNFIDNVSNVDTCKVSQLQSMISQLGVKYTVFNDIQSMPLDIQNLIDTFSIKREYLTSYVKMNNVFVNDMLSGITRNEYDDVVQALIVGDDDSNLSSKLVNEEENVSCAISGVTSINKYRNAYKTVDPTLSDYWTENLSYETALDDNKLNSYLSAIYKVTLLNKLRMTYNDKMQHIIYKQLSSNILLSDFALVNELEDQIVSYKLLYNIPMSFNVQTEVDKYENGEVELSNYTQQQISVLQMEIDRRKSPFINEEPKTRYKFYREREVKEYTEFIQNEYSILTQKQNLTVDIPGGYYSKNIKYQLDPSYIELYKYKKDELALLSAYKVFKPDEDEGIVINIDIVEAIAQKLVEITNGIRDAREQIKMQCQKFFMRGTKLLLNSIICDYLRSNIVNTLAEVSCIDKSKYVFDFENNKIDIVEYIDPTNYYNISTATDAYLSASISDEISALHEPYWKMSSTLNAIGAVDGTNLFVKLPTLDAQNFIFNDETISSFYNDMLKNKFSIQDVQLSTQLDQLKDFLEHLFALGADTTFLSNDVFHTYDSYEAKQIYNHVVADNAYKLSQVNTKYANVLSLITNVNVPPELATLSDEVDQNQTLLQQLDTMYEFIYDAWTKTTTPNSPLVVMYEDVAQLCGILYTINEEQEHIALSSLSAQLSSKYELQNYQKQQAYEYALKTDSYVLQQEYNTLFNNYNAGYHQLSAQFNTIVSAGYIPEGFKQENLTLQQQVSSLCLCLSAQPASSRSQAVRDVKALSTTLYNIGKLSVTAELEIMLETLSSQFEEELGYKQTEIDVLRSSDVFKHRENVFKQYSGTSNADTPFYYMSNVRHPSYMLHPYLSNYVESEEYDYDVDNIANLLNPDESKQYMLNNLSDLIDNDGYLINIWQNPLNSNTDYQSRYEQVSHRTTSGTESEVIGYDGLFYPNALYDFLRTNGNEVYYTEDLRKWNLVKDENEDFDLSDNYILSGNFIDSLAGYTCYNTQTGLWTHVVWNPWYKHLDLSENEASFIAEQLKHYKAYISQVAQHARYDIYRYGLDAFSNSYILVKDSGSDSLKFYDFDEDYQLSCSGCLWTRIKNHPIAFPAYEYDSYNKLDSSKCKFNKCQQITVNSDNCNKDITAFKPFKAYSNTINTPGIQDFTFSNNGNVLVLNGKMSDDADKNISASYPVIVNVDQSYSYDTNIDRMQYFHYVVDVNNPIVSIIPQNTIITQLSDWNFQTYFYDEDKIGVIYSKINSIKNSNIYTNDISVVAAYYNLLDKNVKRRMLNIEHVDTVTTIGSKLENICVDANGNIVTVAYLNTLPDTLSNYLALDINLNSLSTLYGIDSYDRYLSSMSVKTKEYEIGQASFIQTRDKSYAKYTDAGFFGLVGAGNGNEKTVNYLGDTNIAINEIPKRGIYKYQILADETNINNMINYRQVVIARPYEQYTVIDLTTPQGTVFHPISYMSAHYYEALNSDTTKDLSSYSALSSNVNVYDPWEFRNVLAGRMPALKIDENYKEAVSDMENILSDGYPYICKEAPVNFENPWGQSTSQSPVSHGNCMLQFNEAPEFPPLSIQWARYATTDTDKCGKIQIDFNPMYNAESGEKNALSVNKFNNKKLFLNLNRAGEAGYIDIYSNPMAGDFHKLATYYIKNLSDDKPKFLLSADFIEVPDYPGFIVIPADREAGYEGLLCDERPTLTKIAYEQKKLNIH